MVAVIFPMAGVVVIIARLVGVILSARVVVITLVEMRRAIMDLVGNETHKFWVCLLGLGKLLLV